jgi:hypothetical protein
VGGGTGYGAEVRRIYVLHNVDEAQRVCSIDGAPGRCQMLHWGNANRRGEYLGHPDAKKSIVHLSCFLSCPQFPAHDHAMRPMRLTSAEIGKICLGNDASRDWGRGQERRCMIRQCEPMKEAGGRMERREPSHE